MAESYAVKAVLSATDQGFSSSMKSAMKATDSLGSKIKSGLGFGVMMAIGTKAVNAVGNSFRDLGTQISANSKAWKQFSANMEMNGHARKEISATKKELQDFAAKTVYTSSDMASTFSQLDAVGTKGTAKLVKGFGAVAAAAENPTQAMKTMSTQATQMAAKPTVAWQDFKLMLEQTPAGISKVAKKMGMSTQELVKNVQDGTVATDDFFQAIQECADDKSLMKLATNYKTVGEAVDGLQATVAVKLGPAFDAVSKKGISAVTGIMSAVGSIDANALGDKVGKILARMGKYASAAKEAFSGVGTAIGGAVSAISTSLGELPKSEGFLASFTTIMNIAGAAIKSFAGFCTKHSEGIAVLIAQLPKLAAGFIAFKVVSKVAPAVKVFGSSIGKLASLGLSKIGAKLFGVAAGETATGTASQTSGRQVMQAALAFMALGAGVLMIATGFYIIAKAAVTVANAGGAAIAVMFGMIAALAGLAFGASVIGPALTAGAVGFLAFGAAVLMVGAGIALIGLGIFMIAKGMTLLVDAAIRLAEAGTPAVACLAALAGVIIVLAGAFAVLGPVLTAGAIGILAFGVAIFLVGMGAYMAAKGLATVAGVLPTVVQFGTSGAVAIAALGIAMGIFALGVGAAGIAAGIAAIGFAALALGMGALALATKIVNSSMKSIAKNAKSAEKSLSSMVSAVNVVNAGLQTIGSKAQSAMSALKSAFSGAASSATSSGRQVGSNFKNGLSKGLNSAKTAASSAVKSISSTLKGGSAGAYSAGAQIGAGLGRGMASKLGYVRGIAAQLAAAADKAIRAEAKIHSPSKVSGKLGRYWGEGFGNGILGMLNFVKHSAAKLAEAPLMATGPDLAYSGSMSSTLSDDYEYYRNTEYTIVVPVDIDGKEVAKITAPYTEEELNKRQKRADRKKGIV